MLPPPPSEPAADLTDSEIDAATRDIYVTMILGHVAPYTTKDNATVNSGLAQLEIFAKQTAKELKMVSPNTSAKIVFEPGDSHAFGWAKTTVRTRCVQLACMGFHNTP